MNAHCCCEVGATPQTQDSIPARDSRESRSFNRRCGGTLGWLLPSAVLALLPKCPMCLAAWIAATTGLSIPMPGAAQLRWLLLIASAAALAFVAARRVWR
jgi:hypothetical protein